MGLDLRVAGIAFLGVALVLSLLASISLPFWQDLDIVRLEALGVAGNIRVDAGEVKVSPRYFSVRSHLLTRAL